MSARRHATWLVGTTLSACLLGACSGGGGGSDDALDIKPTSDAPSTPAPSEDADGLTPEQRAAADTVVGYFTAISGRGSSPVGPAIQDLTTPQVYDGVVASETKLVDDEGLAYIGTPAITTDEVTIDGDEAVVTGCNNSSGVFLVKKGEKAAGVGSRSLGYSQLTVDLVRDGDAWRVDRPLLEQVASC
jgi:hypothetical protein